MRAVHGLVGRVAIAGIVAVSCAVLWSASLVVPSWPGPPRVAAAADGEPPSRAQLDGAVALADDWLSALYKPLSQDAAVLSEYYGFPLRVYLTRYDKWLVVGRDGVTLSPIAMNYGGERFSVDVRSPGGRHSPRLDVSINWKASPTRYAIQVRNARFDDDRTSAEVYLDDVFLGTLGRANVNMSLRKTFPKTQRRHLRSLRYTIRHGSQEARNYFAYRRARTNSKMLDNTIRRAGFVVNYDLAAPIWGAGAQYPVGMPYDGDSRGFDAYQDCDAVLPSGSRAYPYHSKVCLGRQLYIWLSHSDTLAPAAQAIHVLNKHANPHSTTQDRRFPLGLPVGWDPRASMPRTETPTTIARDLEATFRRNRSGIPTCLFASYCFSDSSGVRTFQFGALETLLGYRFGDGISRSYADAIARIALAVQVRENGIVRSDGRAFYRPVSIGSFYLGWDHALRLSSGGAFVAPVHAHFDMPAEYIGVIPSNAETTLTAYAFLVRYRCERFGVGCSAISAEHGPSHGVRTRDASEGQ
jgi:hypothetical protein